MRFLKLTIKTEKEDFEYFYQMKWIEDIFSQGKEFVCEESNFKVVQFLTNDRANEIVDGTDSNIALQYAGDTFSLTIDDEHPEFQSKYVDIEIIDVNLNKKGK